MPRFWIFMYRLSPFTYYVSAVLSTGVAGVDINCSSIELLRVPPPLGNTCSEYFQQYVSFAGGRLLTPDATDMCEFCAIATTNDYLAQVNIYFADRWFNIGILFVFIAANIIGAVFFYWLVRVPKKGQKKEKKE